MDELHNELFKTLPADVKNYIDQLERMRKDFVANVSHELRTPLTVIKGYLETLLDQPSNPVTIPKEIIDQMYEHSLRMEKIIQELLLLSRLEISDQLEQKMSTIQVPALLKTLYHDAIHISGENNHQITLDADQTLTIQGAEDELKSLLTNIIMNAIKYTPAQGHINIYWQKKDNFAVFSVTDTGIGIAEKHIPRLTERFYRTDKARSRDSGGTGLGLAIVKHVVLRHHGELHITSKLGEGSTFTCCFPL